MVVHHPAKVTVRKGHLGSIPSLSAQFTSEAEKRFYLLYGPLSHISI